MLDRETASNTNRRHIQQPSICAAVVTYGDRRHLVRPVLIALLEEALIWKIVLVNNGARWDVKALADELGPDRIEIVALGSNRGSGPGFAVAVEKACEMGAEFIWLLDDDNRPEPGAVSELLAAYTSLSCEFPKDRLAVVGFRPLFDARLASGEPLGRIKARPSTFFGFHLLDVPYQLWRRRPWRRSHPPQALPNLVEVDSAPYGGLLFHRSVIEKHGLPRADFVNYGGDTEFTLRITRDGGAIRLVTSARLLDLERGWWARNGGPGNPFGVWLERGGDARIFYSARSTAYLYSHCWPRKASMLWINRQVFCLGLWLHALILRRWDRYSLIRRGIEDGLAGRLGEVSGLNGEEGQ